MRVWHYAWRPTHYFHQTRRDKPRQIGEFRHYAATAKRG